MRCERSACGSLFHPWGSPGRTIRAEKRSTARDTLDVNLYFERRVFQRFIFFGLSFSSIDSVSFKSLALRPLHVAIPPGPESIRLAASGACLWD